MKKKGMLVVAIILMAVGFAAVSTTLIINGSTNIGENTDDYSVIFTKATLDGTDVYSTVVDDTKKIINFTTSDLKTLNQTSVLNYEVTNNSSNYDAEVKINCGVKENTTAKYTSIKNELEGNVTIVKAKESVNGTLTVTLNQTSTEEITEEYTCTLEFNAVERTELGISKILIPVTSKDKDGTNLNATSTEIIGTEKEELLNKLKETELINNVEEVDALIEVKSDKFEDMAATTFDVSNIAKEGETVLILHYDETKKEWEYVDEKIVESDGTISADFSSYSPVAFVVKKEDGTYETIEQKTQFEKESWTTIAANVKVGNTSMYNVGDTKEINLGDLGIHTVRVANKSACTNGETSETACGFVVEFADILTQQKFNSTNTNVGGWRDSAMRTYINETIYESLPKDLQDIIVSTKVISGHGSTAGESNFETQDKLYLLTSEEIYSDFASSAKAQYDTSVGTSKQLDYYKNQGVTTSSYTGAIKQYNGSNIFWWLRSASSRGPDYFLGVFNIGLWGSNGANGSFGVSPAFRIA